MTALENNAKVFPPTGTLELHPLSALFPPMTGAEYAALKADIEAYGLHRSIVIHEGAILDGGNRYRACMEIRIEPKTEEFAGGDPVAFVLSANLHRRHLTTGQQAMIVARAQDWAKAHLSHRAKEGCNVASLSTVSDRAATSGASHRTQQMADKLAKASPELAEQVANGKMSLPHAVRQITPADPEPATPAARDPVLPSPFPPNNQSADSNGYEQANTLAMQMAAKPQDPARTEKRVGKSAAATDKLVTVPYMDNERLKEQLKILESDLLKHDKTIKTLNDRLAERGKTIDALKKNRGAELAKFTGRIAERDETIKRLKAELKTFKTEKRALVRADAASKLHNGRTARDDQVLRSQLERRGQLRFHEFDAAPEAPERNRHV